MRDLQPAPNAEGKNSNLIPEPQPIPLGKFAAAYGEMRAELVIRLHPSRAVVGGKGIDIFRATLILERQGRWLGIDSPESFSVVREQLSIENVRTWLLDDLEDTIQKLLVHDGETGDREIIRLLLNLADQLKLLEERLRGDKDEQRHLTTC